MENDLKKLINDLKYDIFNLMRNRIGKHEKYELLGVEGSDRFGEIIVVAKPRALARRVRISITEDTD